MKVPLRELPAHRDVALGPDFVGEAIGSMPLRAALGRDASAAAGEAQAELDLYIEDENVFARGTLRGWLEVACSRCLEAARVPVDESLQVSFLPKGQLPEDEADEELEAEDVAEDDIDVYPYEGEEVDLTPLLREQLIMAVPFAPLCKGDCKGLCAVCGANRNERECGCDRQVVDPRLASLKDFKV